MPPSAPVLTRLTVAPAEAPPLEVEETVLALENVTISYRASVAVREVDLELPRSRITALIGPSGCGKSTLLRSLNRMNDLVRGARLDGVVRYGDQDIYAPEVDVVELRRRVGMVFQKPNPFPKSIYDNVAFGPRMIGETSDLDDRVEQSLRSAALWDEVKDTLTSNALTLSGGQQQRLCIARMLAVAPDVILMDEPCSALDPISTSKIEELLRELRDRYTIVIVTHNLAQAARISDYTAFLSLDVGEDGNRHGGVLIEHDTTARLFEHPRDPRTEAYITGRFG